MLTQEEINNKINQLKSNGIIQNNVENGAPDISGGCTVLGEIIKFKNIEGNFTMVLCLCDCYDYLSSLENEG